MSDPSDIDQGVVSRMVITRYLDADGNDTVDFDTEGDDSLVSRLGALTLSIDTLIRTSMAGDSDDDGAHECE